jgi:hypothetical protein
MPADIDASIIILPVESLSILLQPFRRRYTADGADGLPPPCHDPLSLLFFLGRTQQEASQSRSPLPLHQSIQGEDKIPRIFWR